MMGLTRWADAREPRRPSATRRLRQEETAFQKQITDAAELLGWWWWHDNDSRRNFAGWPDLVLLRPPRLVIIEVKSARGVVSDEQERVLAMLTACGVENHVFYPADWPRVLEVLAR